MSLGTFKLEAGSHCVALGLKGPEICLLRVGTEGCTSLLLAYNETVRTELIKRDDFS